MYLLVWNLSKHCQHAIDSYWHQNVISQSACLLSSVPFIWCYVQKYSNALESDKHIFQDITTESTQQDIVAATVRNEVISKKPVSKSYLSAFMKLYMAKVFQLKSISVKSDFLTLIFDTR